MLSLSNAKQKKLGGYREGSGRSKSGYYKGIFCASTYELAWVVYRIDNQLPVERFKGYLEDEVSNLKYYPDFFVDGSIVEIASSIEKAAVIEQDAAGLWLMPGFVDIHTHYDIEVEISPVKAKALIATLGL